MWVCRLPVHIDPAGCTGFYGNLRRIRNFPSGRQSRRPLRRDCTSAYLVGADDSVRLRDVPILRESSANSQLPGGPMWASAPTGYGGDLQLPNGRSRAPPLPSTTPQISNAERFYRSHLNATAHKSVVP